MSLRTRTITQGVMDSLSNAHTPAPPEDFYTFEGDLCQMFKAANVARNLGIEVGYVGGLPYVQSKQEFDRVVQYIVEHKVEGYWHYTKG